MSTETTREPESSAANDDEALKKKLLQRIAVAGVVILGLLGGLAVFEMLSRPQPETPKIAAAPEAKPEAPAEPEKEPSETQEKAPTEKETVAEEKAATAAPEESAPAISPPSKPLTPPATARQAAIKPSEAVTPVAKPDARREIARVFPAPAGESKPVTPLAKAAAESARRLFLQVGVFTEHANAEELAEKLKAAGIPVRLETRVAAGPFASQKELETARAKLKELGIGESLLVRR